MRILPYDGGLGDVSGYRTVLVRVTGSNFASVIYGPQNFAEVVRSHLAANGVGVNSVQIGEGTNSFTGYYDLLISINALASHDDNTIKSLVYQSVVGDLSGIGIDVVSASQIPTADQAAANSVGGFGSSLGLGLGLSTPVVVGAAALLLVIALKR